MTPSPDKPVSRRAFFQTLLRGAAAGALAGTTWFLFSRRQADTPFRCVNENNCQSCVYGGDCPINGGLAPGTAAERDQP